MGWFSWFSGGNVAAALLAIFMYKAVMNLRDLTDPLRDYDWQSATTSASPASTIIYPSWEMGQTFHLCAFTSRSSRFSPFKVSEKAEKNELLLSRGNLVFDNHTRMDDVTIHLDLVSDDEFSSRRKLNKENKGGKIQHGGDGESEESPLEVVLPELTWKYLRTNSTNVFLHVVLLKSPARKIHATNSLHGEVADISGENNNVTMEMLKDGRALHGVVKLLKHDIIQKRQLSRYLLHDYSEALEVLDSLLGGFKISSYLLYSMPPEQQRSSQMAPSAVLSFWKPEVAVRTVADWTEWPYSHVPDAILRKVVTGKGKTATMKKGNKKQYTYPPSLHVDEISLTSEKYIAVNESVSSLPLKLTYGSLGLSRWLLMQELGASLQMQKDSFGFTDKDIDDVRRLVSETSVWLLTLTSLASVLHMVFELLAFQSDVHFWKHNKSMAGLSARTVIAELISQCVVFLYLLDSDTSLLVTIPAALGVLIQAWKVRRACGLSLGKPSADGRNEIGNRDGEGEGEEEESEESCSAALAAASREADRYATEHLMLLVLPLVVANAFRSLVTEMHCSWYSWFIGSLTASVYAFGFVLMVPQLYINHQLKSVSRMPWAFLTYRFINTFIDDLFAFVIKMPTMHRLSVFRDDVIFLVYLYQRHVYRVDSSRPIEK